MTYRKIPLILFMGFVCCNSLEKISYNNYDVIRTIHNSSQSFHRLITYVEQKPFINYWLVSTHHASAPSIDILIPKNQRTELEIYLKSQNIGFFTFIDNIQNLIDEEKVGLESDSPFGWTSYHTLNEIESWLRDLANEFSEVSLINVGTSYEGRNLTGVHVSFSQKNFNNAVFIESGIHANEWIGPAVSTFLLNAVLRSTDTSMMKLAQSYDWYFLPVANPDGYVYTHTVDRMWRKTRTPTGNCTGTDPNRNWDSHWGEYGASSNPCSNNYGGSAAFSDVGVKTWSEYITSIGDRLVAYIDFHSYSQLLMVPYGYSPLPLDNYNLTYNIGLSAAKSLSKRYGTQFQVGNIYNTIYPASGGSVDWVKATFGTPLVYVYELRDTGKYGFILPPDQIIPSGLEIQDSFITIFEEYEKLK